MPTLRPAFTAVTSILVAFALPAIGHSQTATPVDHSGIVGAVSGSLAGEYQGTATSPSQSPASIPVISSQPTGDPWVSQSLSDLPATAPVEQELLESYTSDLVLPDCQLNHPFAYRWQENAFSWLPAQGDQLGWISWETSPFLERKQTSGITTSMAIHWLNGPEDLDLPARVYDFVAGYQTRDQLGPRLAYDLAATVGVYSDFEDSARDGVRFVSHAVGELKVTDPFHLVFGVDYLDRDDLAILPVIGFTWQPHNMSGLNVRAIFPRPEISWQVDTDRRAYIRGLMGGGTWDIEFPNEDNDVMTYRDFSVLLGVERQKGNEAHRCEIGYVFQRQLEFQNLPGTREMDDAFVIRFVTIE